jgi:glycosidase
MKEEKKRELHISRGCRQKYDVERSLFSLTGSVVFADFGAARELARKINEQRDLERFPYRAVRAGQIIGVGLMHEIFHYIIRLYRRQKEWPAMKAALGYCEEKMGAETLNEVLEQFMEAFPPPSVYEGKQSVKSYLSGDNVENRQAVLEEMLLLWLANRNPAASPLRELFDDQDMKSSTAYGGVIGHLRKFFASSPPFGPDRQPLVDMLQSPAEAEPRSVTGQLVFIKDKWGGLLDPLLNRLLQALDLLKEEEKTGLGGGGEISLEAWRKRLAAEQAEAERFSPDSDWMPNLVMIVKSTYVWLDQLSQKYRREIRSLDRIPDEELDLLAAYGFTGLWLIGIWERSPASRKIKQMGGNPEAMASAYSIYRYRIAADLGGDPALENLKQRAGQRGIRLGADMVPNHMGIDSPLVVEHPDWFIQLDYSPFPAYTFDGDDLSSDDRVEIRLEDHYYDRTDAAVVFKWVDRCRGETRCIYHGNDGTAMPWNDTAQFNYLVPEVREGMIRMILEVAKKFPIIRFDAAMTLSKQHYQRLWFPEPGSGGDIPSRAGHGLDRHAFDQRLPTEFWREVVDRLAAEAPDTLLLAEAFWLMESYFVRSLGMHRVYNSAFMNLLKNEENRKYRQYLKNVLEFNREILRRYVNFMSNPDEETAASQFGKGDKYFGICTLMVTMPGLPMFGHGQIEGFGEKYGMEYPRAYRNEQPDQHLAGRHQNEIFPLLPKRHLFAGAAHFLLYDFFTADGEVDENVLAYSNRSGGERCLVIYHNSFSETGGWLRMSTAYAEKDESGDRTSLRQKSLGEGLGLGRGENGYVVFKDWRTGLEYIRPCRDLFEKGLSVALGAYQRHVFLDFREVQDNRRHHYRQLHARLEGRGVPDMAAALEETVLQPLHQLLAGLLQPRLLQEMSRQLTARDQTGPGGELKQQIEQKLLPFLQAAAAYAGVDADPAPTATALEKELLAIFVIYNVYNRAEGRSAGKQGSPAAFMKEFISRPQTAFILLTWWALHRLGEINGREGYEEAGRRLMGEWRLSKVIEGVLGDLAFEPMQVGQWSHLLTILVGHQGRLTRLISAGTTAADLFELLFRDEAIRLYLQFNTYEDILWFQRDRFESLTHWLCLTTAVTALSAEPDARPRQTLAQLCNLARLLTDSAAAAHYKVDDFLTLIASADFQEEWTKIV